MVQQVNEHRWVNDQCPFGSRSRRMFLSCFDEAGCVTFTGSEAGKVSSSPCSSEVSSALRVGLALPVFAGSAYLSRGAGLKPAIGTSCFIVKTTVPNERRFRVASWRDTPIGELGCWNHRARE